MARKYFFNKLVHRTTTEGGLGGCLVPHRYEITHRSGETCSCPCHTTEE